MVRRERAPHSSERGLSESKSGWKPQVGFIEKESLIGILKPTLVIARRPDCSRAQDMGAKVRRPTQLLPREEMLATAHVREAWVDDTHRRKSDRT